MKLKNLVLPLFAIAIAGIVFSCKKSNNSSSNSNTDSASVQVQSDDQSRVSNENDAVINDVNTTMSAQGSVTGSSLTPGIRSGVETTGAYPVESLICDASVTVDTSNSTRTITITYNGANCNLTRTRTGVVTISIPAGVRWSDKGAVVTVSIQHLKITRIPDSKSITVNGTHTYTNVSGGSLTNLPTLGSITHTVTSDDMTITFDNGETRSWHIARQRVYSYANGIVVTESGMHMDGSTTGITEWGTNRFGNSFETVFTSPVVLTQSCNWRLTSGQIEVIRPAVTITLTLGLDSTGTPTGCPGTGFYYFKLVWQGAGGKTYTFILPY
jgi:hypothetical protein